MIYTITLNPGLDRTLEVDHLDFDVVLRANKTQLDWGGKGLNVARALKELGQESVAMGFLGGDTGRQLERGLHDAGIATDFNWIDGETRTNVVVQESRTGQHIKVNESGPFISQRFQQGFLEKITQTAHKGDWWVLSGSLPPGIPVDFYVQLVHRIQGKEAKALLDTSGEALRLGCTARPYLVKPNQLEAEQLCGFTLDTESALSEAGYVFLDFGITVAAISLGKQGLWLGTRAEGCNAQPPRVEVSGAAVGAGDALLAGLIWALSRGESLEEAARWGVAAGTAAAMRPGVEMGSLVEVEKIYQKVEFTTQRARRKQRK